MNRITESNKSQLKMINDIQPGLPLLKESDKLAHRSFSEGGRLRLTLALLIPLLFFFSLTNSFAQNGISNRSLRAVYC